MPDGHQRPQPMSSQNLDLTRQFMRPAPRRAPGATAPRTSAVSPLYASPAGFSQTPAGRAILQRILQQYTGRRGMGRGVR